MPRHNPLQQAKPSLSFGLLAAFLLILWFVGGASRADVMGQVVTRSFAWLFVIAFILFGPRPQFRSVMPVALLLLGSIALVALQLIPMPPAMWLGLPGRDLLAGAAEVSGQPQPWRPLSISPGATVNALCSLIVPALTLCLVMGLSAEEHRRLALLLLGLVLAATVLGLMQFSGSSYDNPFINDMRGAVSASFANRNHFALFVAIGCLLIPAWAFAETGKPSPREGGQAFWKVPAALALVLLFGLIVLATGSRTGIAVEAVGIVIGLFIAWRPIGTELRRLSRPVAIGLVAAVIGLAVLIIFLSVSLERAVSIERLFALDVGQDLRGRALPTVLEMIRLYSPFGSGFGAFDPVYRIHESDELLSTAYFNHAHNDWLEIVLDGGIAGAALLTAAVIWWLWKSVGAWRNCGSKMLLARIGSATLLLIFLVSIADYPARTPMIMALIMISAVWLNGNAGVENAQSRAEQSGN